jgi:hypothetical protein
MEEAEVEAARRLSFSVRIFYVAGKYTLGMVDKLASCM